MTIHKTRKAAITVRQSLNLAQAEYFVRAAKNTTHPKLQSWLTQDEVDRLIENGMTVTITTK